MTSSTEATGGTDLEETQDTTGASATRVPAKNGATRVSKNGYNYTKANGKWRLTHHLIAEQKILRRPLTPGERVEFKDKDRTNLKVSNIVVRAKGEGSVERRLAVVEDRIRELQAERDDLVAELKKQADRKATKS